MVPHTFAWTPENSVEGVGAISLTEPPDGPLTRSRYKRALAARIDRLVAAEDPDDARRLLDIVERRERLVISRDLRGVGELVTDNSDWLDEKHGFGFEDIPTTQLTHEPDTLERLFDGEDNLEAFLLAVYYLPGD